MPFEKIQKKEINKDDNFYLHLLENFASQEYQDYLTYQKREKEHQKEFSLNQFLLNLFQEKKLFERYLHRFSDYEGKVEFIDENLISLETEENDYEFPEGYALKGGAARMILEKTLCKDSFSKVRDVDIVFVGEEEDFALSNEIAKKYSPDDLAHGYGVERLEDDYFETRDFTINEVLVLGNKILLTKQCLLDTLRQIVRVSDYEKRESYYGAPYYVNDKLMAKALRLIAEKIASHHVMEFANEEVFHYQGINHFHMALHFDRAMEQGYDVAIHFLEELKKRKQIPENIQTAKDFFFYLQKYTDFLFRNVKEEDFSSGDQDMLSFEIAYHKHFGEKAKLEEKYQFAEDFFEKTHHKHLKNF